MPLPDSLLACHRLGMGTRPGDCEAIAADPRAALLRQLQTPHPPPLELRRLPTSTSIAMQMLQVRGKDMTTRKTMREAHRLLYKKEAIARTRTGVRTEHEFIERLVRFFSDVLTVSRAHPAPRSGWFVRLFVCSFVRSFVRSSVRSSASGCVAHSPTC